MTGNHKYYEDLYKNELIYKGILDEKNINDLGSNDLDKVILKLYEILRALRNDINHDRQTIELSTYSLLKDICDSMLLTTSEINLSDFRKSRYIKFRREGTKENIYCLNAIKSIGGTYVYRDMNYQTIVDIGTAEAVREPKPCQSRML